MSDDQDQGNTSKVDSSSPVPGHLQVTVSGPAAHVMAALNNMKFQQSPTLELCLHIALVQTRASDPHPPNTLGNLGMTAPEVRKAYTERCALDLLQQTGFSIQASQLSQDAGTTVLKVAEDMFDATT